VKLNRIPDPGNVGTPDSKSILVDDIGGSSRPGSGALSQVKYQVKITERPLIVTSELGWGCLRAQRTEADQAGKVSQQRFVGCIFLQKHFRRPNRQRCCSGYEQF